MKSVIKTQKLSRQMGWNIQGASVQQPMYFRDLQYAIVFSV